MQVLSLASIVYILNQLPDDYEYSASATFTFTKEEFDLLNTKIFLYPKEIILHKMLETKVGENFYLKPASFTKDQVILALRLLPENPKLFQVRIVTADKKDIDTLIKIRVDSDANQYLKSIFGYVDQVLQRPSDISLISFDEKILNTYDSVLAGYNVQNQIYGFELIENCQDEYPEKLLNVIYSITFYNKRIAENFLRKLKCTIDDNNVNVVNTFYGNLYLLHVYRDLNDMYVVNMCFDPCKAKDFPRNICLNISFQWGIASYREYLKIFY